jgi:hypothetical protein
MAGDDDGTVRARIREVLLNDWDPLDASRNPAARGSYDGYIDRLLDLLRSGADEQKIVEFLHEREQEMMCFPSLDTRRLRPVARKLVAIMSEPAAQESRRTP